MTASAQTNQVTKPICGFVVVQSIKSKWLDVMNIKSPSKGGFVSAAKLAFVAIPVAGLPSLSIPIWPVVIRFPTNPCGVFSAIPIFGFPRSKARVIAKSHFPILANLPWGARNNRPTVIAWNVGSGQKSRGFFTKELPFKCLTHAVARAVIIGASTASSRAARWRPVKDFCAICARQIKSLSIVSIFRWDMLAAANFCSSSVHVCASLFYGFICHEKIISRNVARIGIRSEGYATQQNDLFAEVA